MSLVNTVSDLENKWSNHLSEHTLLHINIIELKDYTNNICLNIEWWSGLYYGYKVKVVKTETRFILPGHLTMAKTKLGKILYRDKTTQQ